MTITEQFCPVTRVTNGPEFHFFGYYDKCPWDKSGRFLLANQNSFMDRNPTLADPLTIGVIDLENGNTFEPLGQTLAWNWQQGCMLRWSEADEDPVIFYNDLRDDHYVCVRQDINSGQREDIPWALYDLTDDGKLAATLNFERITDTRPGYGYFGRSDPFGDQLAPVEDGIYIVDMSAQTRRLIFSLADALNYGKVLPDPAYKTWFNHIEFSPSGSRMAFLHRWAKEAVPGHHGFRTRMMVINADGTAPVCLIEGIGISHFDWLDDETIVVWLWEIPQRPDTDHYYLVKVPSGERQMIGEELFAYDGHCNFDPGHKWMLTDTYPKGDRLQQQLMLYDFRQNHRVDIGAFQAISVANDSWRCDLHPRWNRDGTQLCLDSTHEGTRQMYIVDVSEVVG